MNKKIKVRRQTKKEREYEVQLFNSGIRVGRNEVIEEIVKILGLDSRYERKEKNELTV